MGRIRRIPRFARQTLPGAVYHVISRFVDREFRLNSDVLRSEYLRRAAVVTSHCNWRVLAYALMSSHIHWVLVCNGDPISKFIHPLHVGFSGWINRAQRRTGPVFSQRPTTVVVKPEDTLRVLAYVHNNPVRAGVVSRASESNWSSHLYYLEANSPPIWMSVELGLQLAGFTPDSEGRANFDEYVISHSEDPRDPILSGTTSVETRTRIRESLGVPIELESPILEGSKAVHRILAPNGGRQPRPNVAPEVVVREVSSYLSIAPKTVFSKSRARRVTNARRLVLIICCQCFGHRVSKIGGLLGISTSSASDLLHRHPQRIQQLTHIAEEIVATLQEQQT